MHTEGIEPSTPRLQVWCSTTELRELIFTNIINPTPPEGLEPSTSRLEVWRSIQLC